MYNSTFSLSLSITVIFYLVKVYNACCMLTSCHPHVSNQLPLSCLRFKLQYFIQHAVIWISKYVTAGATYYKNVWKSATARRGVSVPVTMTLLLMVTPLARYLGEGREPELVHSAAPCTSNSVLSSSWLERLESHPLVTR